ncbi:MAG: hypothetical protein BRC58_05705 [Cyanobacteria bacterium QS_8_64_29]|nr:MAG: hypothetical protein BRC58_05705 [Cyanobacteria bacterium QS_8_64_29]
MASVHLLLKLVSRRHCLPSFRRLAPPQELFFPSKAIARDALGNLQSPAPLSEGLTYTAISRVPLRDRARLRAAPERHPDGIAKRYLQLPAGIRERVRARAQSLLAEADRPLESAYERALFPAQALKQTYRLQAEQPPLPPEADLVEAFLFRREGGRPDHFATVLTVMLRSLGIPARLATGFSSDRFNPLTGFYLIRNTDAHALTEVYFPGQGWFAFDPIPGHPLVPPSVDDARTFSVLQQLWHAIAGWLPSPLKGVAAALWARASDAGEWLARSGWHLAAGLGTAIALGVGGRWGWQQLHAWGHDRWLAQHPPAERYYRQALAALARRGHPKRPAQTPLEYEQQLRQHLPAVARHFEALARAYGHWRYGHRKPAPSVLARELRSLRQCLRHKRAR